MRPPLLLRSLLLPATILLGTATSCVPKAAAADTVPADPIVGTINQEPVSAAEYKLVMDRKAPLVYSQFKRQHNLDDHPGYWSASSGPDGPLAALRTAVRDELVRIKVCQGLAKEKGLLEDATFPSFVRQFERENARRRAARLAGDVVYGPPQYRLPAYYYIRFGDLVFKLKKVLAKELEPGVTDAEITRFLDAHKDAFADMASADARKRIVGLLSTEKAENKLNDLRVSARVRFNPTLLSDLVPRVDPEPDHSG